MTALLEARDLARIWYLWLRNGSWNGTQIVTPEWVRESVTPAMRVAETQGAPSYGFKWWLYLNPVDTTKWVWSGSGFGGQSPMAIAELDLIVVFNGWNILPGRGGLPRNRVLERIIRATSR